MLLMSSPATCIIGGFSVVSGDELEIASVIKTSEYKKNAADNVACSDRRWSKKMKVLMHAWYPDTSGGSEPDSGRDPDACKSHKAVAIWQFRTAGTHSVSEEAG
ncbi:unnamed protein product [Clonostachys solani]|uniref:Uncharacterized protein n=1 Tax=Clonostachys solani TaxID=160281 RepID=A0A9P0EAT2_9HYPO|nr:unnamed protein product [Clonostachys solani]